MVYRSLRLLAPIARVQIGNDEYLTGDNLLRHVSVTLGEDDRSSTCRFEVADKGLLIAAKYFDLSFRSGGIQVPADLLRDPNQGLGALGVSASPAAASSSSSSANGQLSPRMRAFLDTISFSEGADYNVVVGGGTFNNGYKDHPRIFNSSLDSDAAGRYQFISTTWDGLNLPDFSPANQDKGAAILIDRDGHATADVEAGNFESAVYKCNGIWASFPGSPYGQPTHSMAELRRVYDAAYAKYSGGNPPQQAATQQPAIQDVATSKPIEVSQKGVEIIVSIGYELDQLISYHFIHTATTTRGRMEDSTVFEGQCIRWLMTRRVKNAAYSNITLRQLAEGVCKNYGLTLEMEGDGPTFSHLDQTGITDYELLLRECRAIGYVLQDKGKVLILKPIRPSFTGFCVTQDMLKSIQFADRASKDMQGGTIAAPVVPSAENKTRINRLTGQVEQQNPEDTTGTGKLNATKQISLDTPAETVVGGLLSSLGITGSPVQRLHGTPASGGQAIAGIAGNLANPTYKDEEESTAPVTARTNEPDPVTGLPRQEIGAIDLSDGSAEAQTLRSDNQRVKGYESKAVLIMTPESLQLAPGSIIGISYNVAPDVFSREWRVSSVKHSVTTSGAETEIEFYSPQAKRATTGVTPSATPESTSTLPGAAKDGWASPMPIQGNSASGAEAEFGYSPMRGRLHAGLDFGGNGSGSDPDAVYAACTGTVTYVGTGQGYGNIVEITRSDGWWCRNAHLASWVVQQGQQVQIGQKIGVRGNTGGPYEIHLHFEIRDPQGQPHNPRDYLPQPQIPEV